MEQHNIINRYVPDSPYPSPHSGEFVMYSDGVAKVSASKLEFITLKITNRADINGSITDLFNYLAEYSSMVMKYVPTIMLHSIMYGI